MKRSLCIALALTALVAADPLDEGMARLNSLSEGRVDFQVKLRGQDWQPASHLVFRRPNRFHFWCEVTGGQPPRQVHCWLDQSRLWAWTSETGEGAHNVYTSEDVSGGLKDAPTHPALGPANYFLMLLSGQRDQFDLDPAKSQAADIWTLPDPDTSTDQLILDPASHLLQQIVAWKGGQEMARARLEFLSQPVREEDLVWKMPPDSTLMKQP